MRCRQQEYSGDGSVRGRGQHHVPGVPGEVSSHVTQVAPTEGKQRQEERGEQALQRAAFRVNGWLRLVCESDLCCPRRRLDPLRGPRPEDRTRAAHPLAAAV